MDKSTPFTHPPEDYKPRRAKWKARTEQKLCAYRNGGQPHMRCIEPVEPGFDHCQHHFVDANRRSTRNG